MESVTLLDTARRYVAAGVSVIPVRADGTKAAAVKWSDYQDRHPAAEELAEWFGSGRAVGIALVCGKVSGNLAVIDFESDTAWQRWHDRLSQAGAADAIAGCPVVKTPRGRHLYCRIAEGWVAGGKLAMLSKSETFVEVRGQGHYVLAPGCPAACHPLNLPYTFERVGWFAADAPSALSIEQFTALCDLARELNEYVPPDRVRSAAPSPSDARGDRPGDDFNRRASWEDVLKPHQWAVNYTSGEVTYWTRPGKSRGTSATTGKCRSDTGGDLLYVFSANAGPLEFETAYDKFGAYTHLNHGGDFKKAATELKSQGFGKAEPVAILNPLTAAPGTARSFLWMSELTARPANEKWLWHGYLSRGGITLLSALWKSGKSTLLAHLLKAFDGQADQFCGRVIKPCKVLYVTEEDAETWAERRDELKIGDHAGMICRPFLGRPNVQQWGEFVARINRAVEQYAFDVIVFDTISKLWPVKDENDATGVEEALMPLWSIAHNGTAVLVVHHTRKAGGTEFTESRGSGGLPAFCETLVTLRRENPGDRKNRKRVLDAGGRFRDTPPKWVVELSADNLTYVAHGEPDDDQAVTLGGKDRWMAWLPDLIPDRPPGLSRDEINALIADRNGGIGAAPYALGNKLDEMYEAGVCHRLGSGVRGKPFRYCLAWEDSDANPAPVTADGPEPG